MSKTLVFAVALVADLLSSLGAFAQSAGSAGTGRTSTGTGRPGGPRNTKRRLDPATRSSDEQYNRKRQSQPFTKKLATASQCDSKKCAGPTEIITLESKPRDRKPRPMEGPRGGAKSASGLEVWCCRRLETERIYGLAGAQITHSHVPLTCYELVSSERET